MIFSQIFDMLNIGIVVLGKNYGVCKWNRWMEIHSKIPGKKILGSSIFEFFPHLNTPRFIRNFKSVSTFGNFAFFSQKLHKHLFPFEVAEPTGAAFDYMQQSCTMGPLRDENNAIRYVYIMVQDVTEIASYEQKLLEMNMRDGLTGVYNRRYFERRLEEEFDRYKRYGHPFSIIMQDIDFFKKVNDTYGHQAGDYILKAFSRLTTSSLRKVDVVARYGGEEFCCLLPETILDNAERAAEKLRKKIKEEIFQYKQIDIKISVSQGVAEVSGKKDAPELLFSRADEALYEAKKTGRNKVVKSLEKNGVQSYTEPSS